MLQRVQYKREEDLIIFDPFTQKKLNPIYCVNFNEDFYMADLFNAKLRLRRLFKKAVVDILIMI